MGKYIYLFRGGNVSEDQREANTRDWMKWLSGLSESGHMVEGGAPLDAGVVVGPDSGSRDFDWSSDSGIAGFTIVEAESVDQAKSLLQGCPQLDRIYGEGTVEVRPLFDINM